MHSRQRNKLPAFEATFAERFCANLYPIASGVQLRTGNMTFSIATDRSQGATSLADGQLDVVIHRWVVNGEGVWVQGGVGASMFVQDDALLLVGSVWWR
jgi:hypothetical protein